MNDGIRGALREVLPTEALLPESAWASWPPGPAPPAAFVAPASVVQIASLMERASREGWRVLPTGLCTWLGGGGASEVDVVVSTRQLKGVTGYEPADLTCTADAGIPWRILQEATRAKGQWLPLDPPGFSSGSLGALVATGVSGPLRHAFGAPRDHILGVTLVSGDGRILEWGGRVVKNVAGFDITRLSIGSWGALGVITSVSARLFPLPEADLTILIRAPSAEDLLDAAREMAISPLPFSAVELLEPVGAVRPPLDAARLGAALVLRVTGSGAQVREVEARVTKDLSDVAGQGPGSVLLLRGPESAAFQEALSEWEEGIALVLRLSALPSRIAFVLTEARELADRIGASVPGVGVGRSGRGGVDEPSGEASKAPRARIAAHMGQGILRMGIPVVPQGEDSMGELARDLKDLRSRLELAGGSLTLSHGPFRLLKDVGAWGEMGPEAPLVRGLKREFDPAGILLPGRFGR